MRIVCQPFAQRVQRPAAHRFLAARVIDQAFRDARNPNGAPIDGASARAFLSGSLMLSYSCEVAELDLNCVIVRARTLMAAATLAGAAAPAPLKSTETLNAQKADICHPRSTPRHRFLKGGQYLEMPGLRLTAPQAQRLFGLDSETWDAAPRVQSEERIT